jgi:hypothetical protein
MRRGILVILLLVFALVMLGAFRKSYTETALDITSDASSAWVDYGRDNLDGCLMVVQVSANFDGTNVTFDFEHSPDKTFVLTVKQTAALTASDVESNIVAGPMFRYMRVTWAQTGSPTLGTANYWIRCKGA